MKTVLLFRHGKSNWKTDFEHDHERPLAKRGRKAARAMGTYLREAGSLPDAILTSTAVRAQETLQIAREAGEWEAPTKATRTLYLAEIEEVLQEIQQVADEASILLIVNHEPTCSETIEAFMGGGTVRFPTAAMARIDLDIDHWADARFGEGTLIWLVPPRLL